MLSLSYTLSHYHKLSYITLTFHFGPLQKTVLAWHHQNKYGHVNMTETFSSHRTLSDFIIYTTLLKTLTKPNFPVIIPAYGQFIL